MKVNYPVAFEDFEVLIHLAWASARAKARIDHYSRTVLYSAVLLLGGFAAYKAEQVFLIAIFLVLFLWYWKQNWSFSRNWNNQIRQAVSEKYAEVQNTLELNDTELIERFEGISVFIPWPCVKAFTRFHERLVLCYVSKRFSIIPERSLDAQTMQELITKLKQHNVQEEPAPTIA